MISKTLSILICLAAVCSLACAKAMNVQPSQEEIDSTESYIKNLETATILCLNVKITDDQTLKDLCLRFLQFCLAEDFEKRSADVEKRSPNKRFFSLEVAKPKLAHSQEGGYQSQHFKYGK